MTMPPCDHCGRPWAHGFDGPPVKRDVGKVIVIAVLGGVVAQIMFIVLAGYVYVSLSHQSSTAIISAGPPPGPTRPVLQACTLFDRWEAKAGSSTNLLNQAVADAYSPRVPWRLKRRLTNDLSGLRSGIREATYAHSRMTTASYEHAIQADCAPTLATWRHFWRRLHHRSHRHRPGQAPHRAVSDHRSARPRQPGN